MHRTLIQLDETLYEELRSLAFAKGESLAATIRELLRKTLSRGRSSKRRVSQFKFVGMGRSKEGDVARDHDRYLAEDLLK